jgi:mycothiol synthase
VNSTAAADVDVPPGFAARAIDPGADAQAVTDLINLAAVAEYGTPNATLHLVRESYNSPGFDPDSDGRLVIDSEGNAVAVVEFYDDSTHVYPFVYARVHPDLLEAGIGEALLAWAEQRGEHTAGLAAPDLRVSLHGNASGVNQLMQRIFERRGWAVERVFWTMEIDLNDERPMVPRLPEAITIRTAAAGQDEHAVHEALDEAFADHWGFLPRTFDEWLAAEKLFTYDPSLWFLAVEGDQIAGIALCLFEAPGRPEMGWVRELAVRSPWRGRGLGLALLKHAFAELHRCGKRQVGLTVDSESLTGATRLYERAGMHVARDERSYARVLREGREIRPV